MVALSVSISAMMSPALTGSPSFFSHLARLPFSIVGESAGIRMLIGMGSAQRAGGSGIGRRIHLGIVERADALHGFFFAELVRINACDVARDVRDHHAECFGVVERA